MCSSQMIKLNSIAGVRAVPLHCATALTRNDLALNYFLGFRKARRRGDRSRLFRSCAKSRFHLTRQFQPQRFEIAVRCAVIGSDGSPTTSQEIWQRPSSDSCSKMRPNSPSTRCRKTYVQADSRCFSKDTSGGDPKAGLVLPSRGCAVFGTAPSRSTMDARIAHSSSTTLERVSDLPRSWPTL